MNVMKTAGRMTQFTQLGILFLIILLSGITPQPHTLAKDFQQAQRALEAGRSPAAAHRLAALAERVPWRADLWEQAGEMAYQFQDYAAAIEYFEAAPTLSLQNRFKLAEAYAQSGNLPAALQVWESLGDQGDALPRLASAFLQSGDFEQAIQTLQRYAEHHPRPDTDYQLGLLLAATNPAAAPPYLLRAAEGDPSLASTANLVSEAIQRALGYNEPAYTLLEAGRALASLEEWELAGRAFYQAVSHNPAYAEAWAYLGEAYQQTSPPNLQAAQTALEEAYRLSPDSAAVNLFMALFWQRQNEYSRARPYLETASQAAQSDPFLLSVLGELWVQQGDLEKALSFYQQRVELTPYDAGAHRSLAEFCLRNGYHVENIGLQAARQAVLLAPNSTAALDTLGQTLYRLGDRLNGERFFQRALEIDPDYPPALLHLGIAYYERGQAEQARWHLQRVLTLAAGSPTAEHAQRLLEDYFSP